MSSKYNRSCECKSIKCNAEKNDPKYEKNISHMIVNLDLGMKISRKIER